MVAASHNKHELPRFMLHFGDFEFRVFSFEQVRVEECGFVAQVLWTLAEVLREVQLGLLLYDVGLVGRDAVPELGLALVHKING